MTASRKARLRWAVPAVVAVATTGAFVASSLGSASAAPEDLAPKTAQELLTDLASPTTEALSGTVEQSSDLGLPELPGAAGGELGPMSLATGTNTLRVWADGPDRSRVALEGQLAEYNVVRSGTDVWTYSNQKQEVGHLTLPEGDAAAEAPAVPPGMPSTPAEAASIALAAVDPSTEVSVDAAITVADRPARQLVLAPRDAGTLVGSVKLAVDAETSVPLRMQVFAADAAEPAYEVGFTDVDFATPDASVFDFTPPEGAEVTELTAPATEAELDALKSELEAVTPEAAGPDAAEPDADVADARPIVTGSGWASIVEFDGASTPADLAELEQLTTPVTEGRVFTTALMSVLLTDDGRILAGAVPVQALQDAA